MRGFVIPVRAVSWPAQRRPLRAASALLVVAALSLPVRASATPADDNLEARALALDDAGHDAEAAALWEQLADLADDDDTRLIAYVRALGARERAYEASGEARHLCAARVILARALADERIADEGRRELTAQRPALEAHTIDCTPPEPTATAAVVVEPAPPSSSPPVMVDAPKIRSPRTIVGAGMAGVAAASLGGFIYAAAADRAIVRGYRRLGEQRDATGTYDEAVADRLDAEAPIVRDLMIGLGVTTAALTSLAIGLIVTGRRPRTTTTASISVHPQARRDLGGVAITGRF